MADITSNLELHYRLTDTSGTTVTDSSGNARHGTLTNLANPSIVTGPHGLIPGWSFAAASSHYISFPSLHTVLGDNASFTTWAKVVDATPNSAGLTGFAHFGAVLALASSGATHYLWTDGLAYFGLFRSTSDSAISRVNGVSVPGTLTNWHHLAFTTTPGANGWKLYVDGVIATQTTGITGVYYDADAWSLGRSHTTTTQYYYDGSLADVRIYSRAITQSDILALISLDRASRSRHYARHRNG